MRNHYFLIMLFSALTAFSSTLPLFLPHMKTTSRYLKPMKLKGHILEEANAKSRFEENFRPSKYITQCVFSLEKATKAPQTAGDKCIKQCIKDISHLTEIITPIHNALTNNIATSTDSCPDKKHNEEINAEFQNMAEAYQTIKTIDVSQLVQYVNILRQYNHSSHFSNNPGWEENLKLLAQINPTFSLDIERKRKHFLALLQSDGNVVNPTKPNINITTERTISTQAALLINTKFLYLGKPNATRLEELKKEAARLFPDKTITLRRAIDNNLAELEDQKNNIINLFVKKMHEATDTLSNPNASESQKQTAYNFYKNNYDTYEKLPKGEHNDRTPDGIQLVHHDNNVNYRTVWKKRYEKISYSDLFWQILGYNTRTNKKIE